MKLRSKVIIITDAAGSEINIEEKDTVLSLNGQRLETKLQDVCGELEFDDGEFYANTLLSYYGIQPDGSLQVEGSHIQLLDAATGEQILVKEMKRPSVHDDIDIPFEHVQKFAECFKVAKPDEVFHNLNESEKQVFIDQRIAASQAAEQASASDNAKKQADEAQAAAQAEAELKASIDPTLIQEQKEYNATKGFYAGIDFKEYIKGPVHLFYGKDDNNLPCVLIKRGNAWWEECPEPEVLEETDTTLVISYLDGEASKRLTLDIASGEVTIEDDKA